MEPRQAGTSNQNEVEQFFQALYDGVERQFFELRTIESGSGARASFFSTVMEFLIASLAVQASRKAVNVYFGVCPRWRKSGTKDDVSLVPCLWADLDAKNVSGGKEAALKTLREFPLKPTAIVGSGNGYHAYWFFREPELIESERDVSRLEGCLRGIAVALGADTAVAELARILRVPGTFNVKDPTDPKPVAILEFDPDRRYNLSDFDDWADNTHTPIVGQSKNSPGWIGKSLTDLGVGNRHDTFLKITGRLCRDGYDRESIMELLRPHAEQVGFDVGELDREIRDLIQKETRKSSKGGSRRTEDSEWEPQIVCLADVEPEEVQWLWKPYIPLKKLTFFDGNPGAGKSTLLVQIAAALSNGLFLPGQTGRIDVPTVPSSTLYLVREDGIADTLRPRVDRAGGDAGRIFVLKGRVPKANRDARVSPVTLQDVETLRKSLRACPVALVVIDPIQSFLGKLDMNKANETRPVLDDLAALAEEFGCAIVGIRHLGKTARDHAIYRGLGSIDFSAAARSIVIVGKDPSDPSKRIMAHPKMNCVKEGVSQSFQIGEDGGFYWTGATEVDADALLAPPQSRDEKSALEEAVEFLEETVGDGPLPISDIKKAAKKAGIAWITVERAKRSLEIKSRRQNQEGGSRGDGQWLWGLPERKSGNNE